MLQALRKPAVSPVLQEVGAVEACGEGGAVVRTAAGLRAARRAVSCLVEPEVGDKVLVAAEAEGEAWLLAVLERRPGAAVRLGAEGDVVWSVPEGSFAVDAAQGLRLATGGQATVAAGALRVAAGDAGLHLERLTFVGRLVHAQAETVKLVAGALDQTLERLWQRVQRSYRFVAGRDHLRAGDLDYAARATARLRGKHTLIAADELAKVDAAQIHLG